MIHHDNNTGKKHNIQLNKPKAHAHQAYKNAKATQTAKEILLGLTCFICFVAIIFATMLISTN